MKGRLVTRSLLWMKLAQGKSYNVIKKWVNLLNGAYIVIKFRVLKGDKSRNIKDQAYKPD